MINLNYFSKKVISARKEMGFTQEEMAERLGVSGQAVSKWERALGLPDVELLLDLSRLLQIPLEQLLTENAPPIEIAVNQPEKTVYYSLNEQFRNDHMIRFLFGYSLIQAVVECNKPTDGKIVKGSQTEWHTTGSNSFLGAMANIRMDALKTWGILLPLIHIKDDTQVSDNECILYIHGKEIWRKDYTTLGLSNEVIRNEIISTAKEAVQRHLPGFINQHMVKMLVESAKNAQPFIFEGVIPEKIDLSLLRNVLREIIKKEHSIRDLVKIVEALEDKGGTCDFNEYENIAAFAESYIKQ